MKNKICVLIIISLISTSILPVFAGEWQFDAFGTKYLEDNGKYATRWRWIDANNDGIAECYRFNELGYLVANATTSDGKHVNEYGMWDENGIVQRIYLQNKKPLPSNFSLHNPKVNSSTSSIINFLDNLEYKIIKDDDTKSKSKNKKDEDKDKQPKGDPRAVFTPSEAGYILGKKVDFLSRPVAEIDKAVINTTKEDDVIYLEEGQVIYPGKDMASLVSSTEKDNKKFTKSVQNVKIWGGDVWEEAMCFSGNGSSAKFDISKYNYIRFELAHQTHGESTADTNVEVQLFLGTGNNQELIAYYDSFNDAEPEIVEEWFEDKDKIIEIKVIVTGDAKGRKVYMRNARARYIKEKD